MHFPDVSNAVRYDSLLVHYLARELDSRLRARRLRGVRMDPDARRLTLELDDGWLVWELHPTRGWIRVVQDATAGDATAAVEGWGGRKVPTQRRPRVRRVSAPPDERWLQIEIDAGGPQRASRFVVELMTNQWNALALTPEGTILSALRTRSEGARVLKLGQEYHEPARSGPPREGVAEPITLERWHALLDGVEPPDRPRALVRSVAWVSPLNAAALLGHAAREPGELAEAWERYRDLASLPPAHPRILELGRPSPYPVPLPGVAGRSAMSLLAALETAAAEPGASTLAPEIRAALQDRLDHVRARAERMRAEAETAPARAAVLRERADLLMAQLHLARKGQREVELDDFQGGSVMVELDPAMTPADNAQALYERAGKRERAARRLPARVRAALAEQNRLETFLHAVDEGRADPDEIARWAADVRPREGPAAGAGDRLPYRRFRSSGGLEIRVGRTGRGNDELTFHHAAPDDVWLHARDAAGAHVILRWGHKDRNPPQRDLLEAAILAALNSRARTSATVPVDWTRRKYVRKPRKAPQGAVLTDRVATVFVRPDPHLPERLRDG
jgi:predicted ribosome quality control (RQC) complex YloA/Tae2 family protein